MVMGGLTGAALALIPIMASIILYPLVLELNQ